MKTKKPTIAPRQLKLLDTDYSLKVCPSSPVICSSFKPHREACSLGFFFKSQLPDRYFSSLVPSLEIEPRDTLTRTFGAISMVTNSFVNPLMTP